MAIRLRAALRDIQNMGSNQNFYDPATGRSFDIPSTLDELNKDYPEYTPYEQAFINAVNGADCSADAKKFVVLMRKPNPDFTNLENGSALMDMSIVFDEAYKLGLARTLEAT